MSRETRGALMEAYSRNTNERNDELQCKADMRAWAAPSPRLQRVRFRVLKWQCGCESTLAHRSRTLESHTALIERSSTARRDVRHATPSARPATMVRTPASVS